MRSSVIPLLCSFAALPVDLAEAVRVGIQGTHTSLASRLQSRTSLSGSTSVSDSSNIQYTTNITLGGSSFAVIIDTGSSDLYVTGTVSGATDTGKTAGVQYAIGSIEGPVKLATLDFAGYTVQNQAYIDVPASQTATVGTGLIGLGPNFGSQVHDALNNASGDTALDNIFRQNTTTPNFLSILLQRDDDPAGVFPGELTIGEVIPGFENVTSQPKLNVTQVSTNERGNQHWQVLLDNDGVIGPDGKVIDIDTGVKSTSSKGQLTVVFDSGFSLPQVPKSVSDAIYSGAPSADFVQDSGLGAVWTLPCDVEINIAFKFGGVTFPINPLDTVLDLNATNDDGSKVCIGAFQPISTAASPTFDMVLGMAFLRNAYLTVNFGDFVDGSVNNVADPYIQMLPLTNDSSAVHNDFVKVRGGSRSVDTSESFAQRIKSHLGIVIAVAAVAGLLILGGIAYCCLRNRRLGRTPAGFMNLQSSYQPLHDPAPPSYNMGPVGGFAPPPGPPPQHANYNNPWDSHY
ncbi:acid protease [Cytidiella melzeri]|nr:acid protease [Cytidiella melzeri]